MLVRLLATDPTNTRLVEDVVNSLAATGKWELAKPVISQAIKDNPGDVRLMLLGFLVYLNAGDNKNGTALGEEMVKIDTSLADTAYFAKMIGAYEADSNSAKAAELAARGVEKYPANATLLGMLGQKQLNAGQQQQAILTFRKILSINPKAPGIRSLIARTYVEMKQLDSALAMLRDGKAAGEEGQGIGAYAVTVANSVLLPSAKAELAKALASKTAEDFATAIDANLRIYPWVTFADSTATAVETRNTAKLIYAVAAYQLSAAALTEASAAKSCPRAKLAQENIMIAQENAPAGGRVAPDLVAQLMPGIASIMTGAEQMVKAVCKP